MKKIERFQITGMTISGFKSYQEPTELVFGNPTTITGGNGQGKTSIADAIAFAITGQPFFGERGIDKLHNEIQPEVFISLRFVDEAGATHELTRTRRKDRMTIHYDGYEIRQMDLTDMFGERDVFLSIFNPLYFIEELGNEGKNLLEMYLPMIPHEAVMKKLADGVRAALEGVEILSPDSFLKMKREEDIVTLFRAGADACLEKPLDIKVCAAQANALIKLYIESNINYNQHKPVVHGSEFMISPRYRQVMIDGKPLALTRREFDLLHCLASSPKQVFTCEQLYDHVWGDNSAVAVDDIVKSQIKRLRRKLSQIGKDYIQTEWGVGYKFVLSD